MERHENPYEILGVPFDADEEIIKKAFRKAAKKYHPDRQQTEEDREKAHDIFAKYSAAYEILTDPVKRYDWKQAYAARNPQSANNPASATPSTGKKPTYTCPQSAPARTSTAYTYKPPTSDKSTSSATPPPPPFAQEKRHTSSSSESPKKKSSSSNAHSSTSKESSWQPPPPKKQAPPPPPFHDDEKDQKNGSKKRNSRKSTSASTTASVSSSSYSFANRGKESVGRRTQEEPTGSYSFVPQLLVSGSHLKEDLRPRLRSSCIFSELPQSNATAAGKEDLRPRPRSSSIFADQQQSNANANGTNASFRRSSSYCPPSSTSNFQKPSSNMDDRSPKQPKRTSTIDENTSKRGRSFSPLRHAANSNKNQEEHLKSTRNIRSQSPRQGRHSTTAAASANVEPASPRRSHRKSTTATADDVPLTPPTKARSFFGLISKSPKTNNFLKELMRDTRVDAEPYRRKKSINHNSDGGGSEDSPKGRRSSIRGGDGQQHVKRSKSLSGDTTNQASSSSSSSKFPSSFRFSISRRNSEKQLDTSYSFSTQQEMDAINSPKPLRRGRRPQ